MAISRSVALGLLVLGFVALSQAATLRELIMDSVPPETEPIILGVEYGKDDQSVDEPEQESLESKKREPWETSWSLGDLIKFNASASYDFKPFTTSADSASGTDLGHGFKWDKLEPVGNGNDGESSGFDWSHSFEWKF